MPWPLQFTDDELIAALKETGGNGRAAARLLGVNQSAVQTRRKKLAAKGWSPDHDWDKPVPDGYRVKGVSSLYDGDGNLRAQWVKSQVDPERQREMFIAACEALVAELPRVPKRKPGKGQFRADLLTAYPIGDPHIGMRAWAAETGQDWDLAIAERVHCGAMAALVESAPASEQALIVNLGDMLHYDSMAPVTPRSGHLLDADGRYAKVVAVAVKVMRQCIESALDKHLQVHVINAPGNHDETGALWMSVALSHIYANEPRVSIDTNPSVFAYYRWGKCLIGIHHGHTCKPDKLPGVMAADRAKDWGETEYRYWWMGHIHHESKREFPGVSVESFNTLSSRDAYAAAGGWRSRESMQAVILHREHGEVARSRVSAAMFREAA